MLPFVAIAAAFAQAPAELLVLHHTDVAWVSPAAPSYPAEARALGLGPVDCRVRVVVTADGSFERDEFLACPAVFQGAVTSALKRARWEPPEVDGVPRAFAFVVVFQFIDDRAGPDAPNLVNAAVGAPVHAEWCLADRVDLASFAPRSDVTWKRTPPLSLPSGHAACAVEVFLDPRGRPVYVAVREAPNDWGYRVAIEWCGARADAIGAPATVTRPCAP